MVANNVIQMNSGGILISDDTGPTHDNVITANLVSNNPLDCGITIAAHSGMGVYHNTIAGNQAMRNGFQVPGAGAGVGIFAPGPGSKAYGNVVVNNQLTANGLPGVTMHNHASVPGAPPVDFNDNVIIGNTISRNGADTEDAATPGTAGINIYSVAPMTGTIVTQNVISQQTVDLAVNAPGEVSATLNNFLDSVGVNSSGAGMVNAVQNWWRCAGGPGAGGCGIARGPGIAFAPVLTSAFTGTQLPAAPGSGSGGPAPGVTIVVTGPGGADLSRQHLSGVLEPVDSGCVQVDVDQLRSADVFLDDIVGIPTGGRHHWRKYRVTDVPTDAADDVSVHPDGNGREGHERHHHCDGAVHLSSVHRRPASLPAGSILALCELHCWR